MKITAVNALPIDRYLFVADRDRRRHHRSGRGPARGVTWKPRKPR